MSKFITTIIICLLTITFFSCNDNLVKSNTKNIDSTYEVIRTTKFMKGVSNTNFKKIDREGTQFNIDKSSIIEIIKSYTIKISDKEVLIYDNKDSLQHRYLIKKRWIDKTGPSDVFDLKDGEIDGSLEHYISKSTDGKHYLGFRFKKDLENYSN